jgi:hypothetical protein
MSQVGWTKWEKHGSGAKYAAYAKRFVIVLSKSGSLFLMPPVLVALKKPDWIAVMTRGSNIGLLKSETPDGCYKVVYYKLDQRGGTPYISAVGLMKSWNLAPGVYDVHIEGDIAVFDTQQMTSRPVYGNPA